MQITLILIALSAFAMTLLGGFFALYFRDKLHLVLGFSAGAVIGVAFFDLLPEAFELGAAYFDESTVPLFVSVGFLIYLSLDRLFSLHGHGGEDDECETHSHRMTLGAGSLSLHSFLDGVAIGLAFQASSSVGLIVTVAVLAHDFSDGVNTISMVLRNRGSKKKALRWLAADGIAPVLGVISTFFFSLPENLLALMLALFCGFFLYIGASDLLPESHHRHPTAWTTFATMLGMAMMYAVIKLAGV